MDLAIYKKLEREYDKKRLKAEAEANSRKQQLCDNIKELRDTLEELNQTAIVNAKSMFSMAKEDRQSHLVKLKENMDRLQTKVYGILESNGYPKNYFEPRYECSKCKDTGFVSLNNTNQYCSCFRQKIVNYEYNQNNLLKLEDENFATFDSGYFSKVANKEKYKSDKSPYENIMQIKDIAQNFCQNIDSKSQKSLMFVGPTGTGKTFMSNAIAKEVIQKGYSVIYQTAPILMDMLINAKFKSAKDGDTKHQYDKVFDVDVLIIDDLGTETLSNTKFTELFNIINTRLLKDKKTIISTNLNLNELAAFYDERVISRIIGNYIICRFFGDDVRLKAKKTSKPQM